MITMTRTACWSALISLLALSSVGLLACDSDKQKKAEAQSAAESQSPESTAKTGADDKADKQEDSTGSDNKGDTQTITKDMQSNMSPDDVLKRLKKGNERFVNGEMKNRNLNEQVKATSKGQYPAAAVLGCVDSRVPPETVFDQGIGDIFSARVAGNFANEDVMGSLEFATKVAGSKLVVVLGHTSCGAVKGSCDNVQAGHISSLVDEIQPSVKAVTPEDKTCSSDNTELVDKIAKHNVKRTIERLRSESDILKELEDNGDIKIVGAMYDVSTGNVTFL